jgi:hypothetical protein
MKAFPAFCVHFGRKLHSDEDKKCCFDVSPQHHNQRNDGRCLADGGYNGGNE